jgi:phosphohistidine phosphatase
MKRQLLIMRHAKADRDAAKWADYERPLNDRGNRDAPAMGRWLRNQKAIPDQVLCSPAVRTRQTAELVARELKFDESIVMPESLYEGSASEYMTQIRLCSVTVRTLLVIGHNPSLESLVEKVTGEFVTLPTAAVAQISLTAPTWQDLRPDCGELLELWTPKTID